MDHREFRPHYTCRHHPPAEVGERRDHRRTEKVRQWPLLETDSPVLRRAYERSVSDFAALELKAEEVSPGEFMLAAGIPWFMALFGRDSLIASYQCLAFSPRLAMGTLHALALRQGTRLDAQRAEEPGKILHEHRFGDMAGTPRGIPSFPYYGSVDATPLFLMLLAATHRVTGDAEFAGGLLEPARRALAWMERYGDRDGDGYLEYYNASGVGLENQGWKDSGDSIRFRDGTLARGPIALCEVQGYACAARLGMAGVLESLDDSQSADRLRSVAAALRLRFEHDFWMPDRGTYALALDGDKRPVDSLTSNPGHLLWAGLADPGKARHVAAALLSPAMFSGWGVRTMAETEGGYNPISYHNGSVWPHDNSLIVAGLARYGLVDEAAKLSEGLLAALELSQDRRFPELFAGYSRDEFPFPVEYPTASRPQAWASGSIFLLLTTMLGLDPLGGGEAQRPFLPAGVDHICIDGLWWRGKRVRAEARRSGGKVVSRVGDYGVA